MAEQTKAKRSGPRADLVGVELLPDGRAVAVGLRRDGDRAVPCFARVAESARQLAEQLEERAEGGFRLNVCLPGYKCVARPLELPSTDRNEIAAMLEFELADAAPFEHDDILHACAPAGEGRAGYTKLLAFVASDRMVNEHLSPLLEADLVPDRVLGAPVCLAAWARTAADCPDDEGCLVSAADRWGLDVAATRDGAMLQGRGTRMDSTRTDANPRALAAELAKSLPRIRDAVGDEGCRALLAVPEACERPLADLLGERATWVNDVGTVDNVCGEGSSADVAGLEAGMPDGLRPALLRAYGAAAADSLPWLADFNLLPRSLAAAEQRRALKHRLIVSGGLLALVLVLAAALVLVRCGRLRRRIEELDASVASIRDTATEVSAKAAQLRVMTAQLTDRDMPLEVLSELYRLTPRGVHVIELRLAGEQAELVGQAQSPDLAYSFPSNLMESALFRKVHLHGAHPVNRAGGTVTEFSCSFVARRSAADRREAE